MDDKVNQTELRFSCEDSSLSCTVPQSSSLLVVHGTDDGKRRQLQLLLNLNFGNI